MKEKSASIEKDSIKASRRVIQTPLLIKLKLLFHWIYFCEIKEQPKKMAL